MANAGLRRDAMTLPHILVQAIASVGPALTVFVTFQPMVALAGINAPLIQIVDLFVVLMLASTLVQLARLFPSAGGYYTYICETLGAGAGFAVSWIYFLYSAISPGILLAYLGRFLQLNLAGAGILLGPSFFGLVWPDMQRALFSQGVAQKAMLDGIAQFGVLLLLLLTGMDTDVGLIRKVGRPAISISLTGVAIPFACGVSLAFFLPDSLIPHAEQRLATALFLGVALSISSM